MADGDWVWERHAVVDSTNLLARERAREGCRTRRVIVADRQTAGRGRLGRSWHSPAGSGAFFTQLMYPGSLPAEQAGGLTFVAALSMARALERYVPVRIKWPNDLITNGKKLVGILAEAGFDAGRTDWMLVGLGVNLTNGAFPKELPHATSILAEAGFAPARDDLISEYLQIFDGVYAQWLAEGLGPVLEEIAPISATLGREVRVESPQGAWAGRAVGFCKDGRLLVEDAAGARVPLAAGEVSVRGIYGYV